MQFLELFHQWTEKRLTQVDAAMLLGISERTFRRYCQWYQEEGEAGLYDARLDKKAHNAASVDEVMELLTLFETRYSHFTVAHFYDMYRTFHQGVRHYNWVKNCLQEAGLVKKAKKKGAHRRKRPRVAMEGMMLHQDGSTHEWVFGKMWDLIATMDDATSKVYSLFFVEEEGTQSSFQGVKEVILAHGLFCALYTDRGSHYWNTPEAGGRVDKVNLTQFGRGMKQLGIPMIAAYSPEARGRSERLFKTLQGRLPKELALLNITTMEEANRYLKEVYIKRHNERFSIEAEIEESAFVPFNSSGNLEDILCIQEQRTVNHDNTVSYKNKILQIPKVKDRCHFVKAQVRVHEYSDGSLAIFHGPRCLGRYTQEGALIVEEKARLAA